MSVQERNSELVDLLSPDFIRKTDTSYLNGIVTGILMTIPGLVSLWPMSVVRDDEGLIYVDDAGQVGIGKNPELTNLDVARGTGLNGTAVFRGTNNLTHINYGTAEDTYIRGGKPGSKVIIGDNSSGDIELGVGLGAATVFGGRVGSTWQTLTLEPDWADYGSGWPTAQFKRVGDLCFVRGLVARSAGSGPDDIITYLPLGNRPATTFINVVYSADVPARVDVQSDGSIIYRNGGNPDAWLSLFGIWFTVGS